MEQQLLLLQPTEFWSKHTELTRQIIREEFSKIPIKPQNEDLIVIEECCTILHKSKQCIYNYLEDGRLQGYTLGGKKVNDLKALGKKEKESLYFLRSEIYASLEKRKK